MDLTDGRKHARVPLRYKIKLRMYENGVLEEPVQVWTRDISASGIGMIYHKPFRKERHFVIRLPRAEESAMLLLCTVRGCVKVANDVYNIGANYTEVPEVAGVSLLQAVKNQFDPTPVTPAAPAAQGNDSKSEIERISNAILF